MAIVLISAVAAVLVATDVAVTVPVFVSPLAAPPGTATSTQTSRESPAEMAAVVVSGVVHDASKNDVAQGFVAESVKLSALKPRFLSATAYGTLVPTRPPSLCVAGVSPHAQGRAR